MLRSELRRVARHARIRKRMMGTGERPRVCVHRSGGHLYVQVIDDLAQKTLYSFSTRHPDFMKDVPKGGTIKAAGELAKAFAPELRTRGIDRIVFDRGGFLYHGRVKAFAEALRKEGIKF